MATAKKTSTAAKIRQVLTLTPNAKVAVLAHRFNVSPAYVYQVKRKMEKPTPKVPKPALYEKTIDGNFREPLFGRKNLEAPITMVEPQADRVEDHPLYAVFMDAIKQAMHGKGERHGGARTPFLEQPWAHYTKMHGRGFATGQATKKLEEAASTRTGEAFEQEVFGAIVYAGMAILKERGQV